MNAADGTRLGARQAAAARRRAGRDLSSLCARGDARGAAGARGGGAEPRRRHRRERDADASTSLGLALRIDPNQRPDEQGAGRAASCSRIRRPAPPRAASARFASGSARARGRPPCPAWSGRPNARARMRLDEDGLEVATVSEFRSPDYPADAVVAQDPAPSSRAPQRLAAAQPRRTGHDLRDARCDRHRRRARRRSAAHPRLPRHDRRLAAVPGRAAGTVVRQQPPAGSACAPATHLARGEPVIQIAPVDPVGRLRGPRARHRRRRARRRGSDPRRRHGRPLRARTSRSARRSSAPSSRWRRARSTCT